MAVITIFITDPYYYIEFINYDDSLWILDRPGVLVERTDGKGHLSQKGRLTFVRR